MTLSPYGTADSRPVHETKKLFTQKYPMILNFMCNSFDPNLISRRHLFFSFSSAGSSA